MGRVAIALIVGAVLGALLLVSALFIQAGNNIDYTAMAPKDSVTLSKAFLEEIRTGSTAGIAAQLDPATAAKVTPPLLARLRTLFPAGPPDRIIVAGWKETLYKSITGGNSTDTTILVLRDLFPHGRVVEADFTLERVNGRLLVYGCHITALTPVQAHAGDFNLAKLSPVADAYLALGLALDVFTMFTFVLCAMGPLPRWRTRWLWMIAILFGLVRVNISLATGALTLVPLSIYLPPAGLFQPDAGASWYLWLSLPVAAIAYWARRPQWRARAPEA